jgi:hypothetical protein
MLGRTGKNKLEFSLFGPFFSLFRAIKVPQWTHPGAPVTKYVRPYVLKGADVKRECLLSRFGVFFGNLFA